MSAGPLRDIHWACRRFNAGPEAIYGWARAGLIPCVHIGRRLRFDPPAIEAFIANGGRVTGSEPQDRSSDRGEVRALRAEEGAS